MAGHQANIQRLYDMDILVGPGRAPRPGVTIPDRYRPDYISEELASSFVRLSNKMEAAGRPLDTLWAHDGVLEPLMRNQHAFSHVHRPHVRPQVVHHAITKLDGEALVSSNGNVVMPAKKFWALVLLEVVLSAIYALFCDS